MHGAGTALRYATTEFRTSQSDLIANDPEQRRLRLDIEPICLSVDLEGNHAFPPKRVCRVREQLRDRLDINTARAGFFSQLVVFNAYLPGPAIPPCACAPR